MNKTKIISFTLGTVFGMLAFWGFVEFMIYYGAHAPYDGPEPGSKEYEEAMKTYPQPGGIPGQPSI